MPIGWCWTVKTDEKSNEITAIPELLKLLDVKGCIVTIDAMGCQRAIAAQIIAQEGDYVLALKGNQGGLYEDVRTFLKPLRCASLTYPHRYHQTVDGDHGRVEVRRYWTVDQFDWLADRAKWKGLNLIGMVESERHIGDTVSVERRYYISSLTNDAVRFGHAVRSHWVSRTPCTGPWMSPSMKMLPGASRGSSGELCGVTTYCPELAAAGKNRQGGSQSQAL